MKTAIIDYGIDIKLQKLYKNRTKCYELKENKIIASEPLYDITHGSICAGIFAEYAGRMPDVSICLGKDNTQRSNSSELAIAMEWCADNDIKLISLSMGTVKIRDADVFHKVVQKLNNADVTVVAAASNSGLITYPAVLDSCIGVSCCNCMANGEIVYFEEPFDGINVVTYPIKSTISSTTSGNSLSAAYIAGIVCAEFGNSISQDKIRSFLSKISISLDKDRIALLFTEKVKYNPNFEPIIIVHFTDSSTNKTQFLSDIRKCIIKDMYTCASLIQVGSNTPSNLQFTINSSPMPPYDTLNFVKNVCKPDIILSDLKDLINYADIVIDQDIVSVKISDSNILKIGASTPSNLWIKIKEIYEN